MWVEKYRPETVAEIVGNEDAKTHFIKWLIQNRRKKAVLLYGPSGIGKTALVHAAARVFAFNVIEMNASDVRTKKAIVKTVGPSTNIASLDRFFRHIKGNLLFLDEIDGVYGRGDYGGVSAIVKLIRESKIPIVMTANITDIQRLRPILKLCFLIKFRRIRPPLIIALLIKICQEEGISFEIDDLYKIVQCSQGDVRSAINDLQTLNDGKIIVCSKDMQCIPVRNRSLDVFNTLRGMFSAKSLEEALKILNSSLVDYDTLLLTIHDNLPHYYRDPVSLAVAYDVLSRADIFRGRIGREKWWLLRYVFELLAQSTVFSSGEFQPFDLVYPPTKRMVMYWTSGQRVTLSTICAKIGSNCHISKRSANLECIPFLKIMLRTKSNKAYQIASSLELDKVSVDFLLKFD